MCDAKRSTSWPPISTCRLAVTWTMYSRYKKARKSSRDLHRHVHPRLLPHGVGETYSNNLQTLKVTPRLSRRPSQSGPATRARHRPRAIQPPKRKILRSPSSNGTGSIVRTCEVQAGRMVVRSCCRHKSSESIVCARTELLRIGGWRHLTNCTSCRTSNERAWSSACSRTAIGWRPQIVL
eukprot:scaffold25653_cov28-Tisochrysis_lutea.AAC.1